METRAKARGTTEIKKTHRLTLQVFDSRRRLQRRALDGYGLRGGGAFGGRGVEGDGGGRDDAVDAEVLHANAAAVHAVLEKRRVAAGDGAAEARGGGGALARHGGGCVGAHSARSTPRVLVGLGGGGARERKRRRRQALAPNLRSFCRQKEKGGARPGLWPGGRSRLKRAYRPGFDPRFSRLSEAGAKAQGPLIKKRRSEGGGGLESVTIPVRKPNPIHSNLGPSNRPNFFERALTLHQQSSP
jgi:hypothetical protein